MTGTLVRCAIPPLVVYPLFLHLSFKWPHFVRTWEMFEDQLMVGRTNHRLHYKIIFLTIIFAAMRLAFFMSGYMVTAIRVIQCVDLKSVSDLIHTLFYVRFPQVYSITPPAYWKHILLMFLELTSTWAWLAVHLLVLDLSLLLSDNFRTFNCHLDRWKGKAATSKFWREMRAEFCRLSLLCDVTDSLLSPMVFASVILETVNVTLFIYLGLT
ncbi:sweet taste receptor activity protein [Homalodisca vitripennis]|nr:sweet taste receptor activity protein [Homalodisca vitripennis]